MNHRSEILSILDRGNRRKEPIQVIASSICRELNIVTKYRVEFHEDDERWYLMIFHNDDNDYSEYEPSTHYDCDKTDCLEKVDCVRIAKEIAIETTPSQIEVMTKKDKLHYTIKFD